MNDLTGTMSGASVALQVSGEHADATNGRIKAIADTTADAGGRVKGFTETQETLNSKLRDARAAFEAAVVEVGSSFIPMMTDVANIAKTVGDTLAQHPAIAHAVVNGLEGIAGAWAAIKLMNVVSTVLNPTTTALGALTTAEEGATVAAGGLRGALSGLAGMAGPIAALGTALWTLKPNPA
jgi:hypothetical protein